MDNLCQYLKDFDEAYQMLVRSLIQSDHPASIENKYEKWIASREGLKGCITQAINSGDLKMMIEIDNLVKLVFDSLNSAEGLLKYYPAYNEQLEKTKPLLCPKKSLGMVWDKIEIKPSFAGIGIDLKSFIEQTLKTLGKKPES